jgi:hypothetical protein
MLLKSDLRMFDKRVMWLKTGAQALAHRLQVDRKVCCGNTFLKGGNRWIKSSGTDRR